MRVRNVMKCNGKHRVGQVDRVEISIVADLEKDNECACVRYGDLPTLLLSKSCTGILCVLHQSKGQRSQLE